MGKALKMKPSSVDFKLIDRDKVDDLLSSFGFEFTDKVMVADLALENPYLIINPAYDGLLERDDEIGVTSDHILLWFWPLNRPAAVPDYAANDMSFDHPYLQMKHKKLIDQINRNDMVDVPLFLADHDMDFREEDNIVMDFDLDDHKKPDGSLIIICRRSVVSFEPDHYPLETEEEILNNLDLQQLSDPKMPIVCTFGLAH